MQVCKIQHDCGPGRVKKGLCPKHYARFKKHDDPLKVLKGGARPTHGLTNSKEYRAWKAMHYRCDNPNSKAYMGYGGRGIKICERWCKFENFLRDMGTAVTLNHSIDRKDNDGNYEPDNCRWATRKEQQNNIRSNRQYNIRGITKNLMQWIEVSSLKYSTVERRLAHGWPIEKALGFPFYRLVNSEFVESE